VSDPILPRAVISTADVAAAAGTTTARDIEPRHPGGAWASLFHAFVVERPAPERPSLVQVFPYASPEWDAEIRLLLAFEVAAWRAWWTSVAGALTGAGIWPIPPLVGTADTAIFTVDVDGAGAAHPAIVRPLLEWPDLGRSGLSAERVDVAWREFRATCAARVEPATRAITGRSLVVPERADQLPEPRRRLLTDGRHVVCTSFRAFDARFKNLDELRARTPHG
jgi:hypothetical protein